MEESVLNAIQKNNISPELRRKTSILKPYLKDGFLLFNRIDEDEKNNSSKQENLWKIVQEYLPATKEAIQKGIIDHVEYTLVKRRYDFSKEDCYRATAYSIRDRLIEALNDTVQYFYDQDVKQCNYLSLEYLLGRAMQNALLNLNIEKQYKEALEEIGFQLEQLYEYEHDPALGNGGLGRLAACYMDSMATLNYPCWGYGLRYTYGIFEQKIVNGYQVEHPDYWLVLENPWDICRYVAIYCVRFHGNVEKSIDPNTGSPHYKWYEGSTVEALAYDNPIPGYKTRNCINLRLWKAIPTREFDFALFNSGNYMEAVRERQDAEFLTAVLYPNDNTEKGKILRLKQQYFFCSASIQDILRRFHKRKERDWRELPDKVVIQLNDTHPVIGITEFMRLLIDVEGVEWNLAWSITKNVFRYTNHTVLPEACEKWSQGLFEYILPRHLLILNDINFQFLTEVRNCLGDDGPCLSRLSIYEEGHNKMIRMANLAIIGSKRVNGVAPLHSHLLKCSLFKDFNDYFEKQGEKDKFTNVTNGVTLRRWVHLCNPPLSQLISDTLKTTDWLTDSTLLKGLAKFSGDPAFIEKWMDVKLQRKNLLAQWVWKFCKIKIDPYKMLFDVHAKRIHEYKRQLLNILYILHRYLTLKSMSAQQRQQTFVPRACIFSGKTAPGYDKAKLIIKFIHTVATWINEDEDVADYLKVAFIPNYNVSSAMVIIAGADIGHNISTAGTEASGTSCFKLVLNGGLIIGTADGANIEIKRECGDDTFFSFGLQIDQIEETRENARKGIYPIDPNLSCVLNFIRQKATMHPDDESLRAFVDLFDQLSSCGNGHIGDYYLVFHDFPDFCRAQHDIDCAYRNQKNWFRSCIKACSSMGLFSSDTSVKNYAEHIWNLKPCPLPPLSEASY